MKSDRIAEELRRAVERGQRIQTRVRDLTLEALRQGELDRARLQKVTREAMQAVREAAEVRGARAQDVMREGIAGIDEALAHAAQALKLSLEEAAGRAEKFSQGELAKARQDLQDLEKLFIDTLRETAQAGRGAASSILDDLAKHAKASGTAVGAQLRDAGALPAKMAQAGREQFAAGMRAAAASGAMMARVASGVLAGFAERLDEKTKPGKR